MKALLLAAALLTALITLPNPAEPVQVPACAPGVFSFIAKDRIGLENGPTDIVGNLLVTALDGTVQVGAHNRIHGTIVAHSVFLGTGAEVDDCIVDSVSGPGKCNVVGGVFAGLNGCHQIPFNPEIKNPCVNTALLVNVPAGTTETLTPGCYGLVRIGAGATLILEDGVYFVRELRTVLGATLQGAPDPGTSIMRIGGALTIGAGSRAVDVKIFDAATQGALQLGNNTTLIRALLVSVTSSIHLHTGGVFDFGVDDGVAAQSVVIEPVTVRSTVAPPQCVCLIPGTHPLNPTVCVPD